VLVLVLMDTVVVALLAVLVAGLLRSHADILRALHSLGAGVGDPSDRQPEPKVETNGVDREARARASVLRLGPPLPSERSSTSAHDLEGVDPDGSALVIPVEYSDRFTLLAFLSSGCSTCAAFWEAISSPGRHGLPEEVRTVVVTKGPEFESPNEIRRLAPAGSSVVMSSKAWSDYEVPGSPFFALVDGREHRRVGEGVARGFGQVAELVRRALADAADSGAGHGGVRGGKPFGRGLDGPEREALNDRSLIAAGINPGHPSLYPKTLEDVFGGPSSRDDGHEENQPVN
jgi:hypothetical protein